VGGGGDLTIAHKIFCISKLQAMENAAVFAVQIKLLTKCSAQCPLAPLIQFNCEIAPCCVQPNYSCQIKNSYDNKGKQNKSQSNLIRNILG
jgi:hypothetical protein